MTDPQQSPATEKTQMTNPPKENTKMVAPKKVKIKALMPIAIGDSASPTHVRVGEEVEVTPEEAVEFCKPFKLGYAFGGERAENDSPRHEVIRAQRVG